MKAFYVSRFLLEKLNSILVSRSHFDAFIDCVNFLYKHNETKEWSEWRRLLKPYSNANEEFRIQKNTLNSSTRHTTIVTVLSEMPFRLWLNHESVALRD